MAVERHLILQETILRPSGEWTPPAAGWVMARVVEGVGYWVQNGSAREFNEGDGFVVRGGAFFHLRASSLGPLKLQFFTIDPNFLNGVLTVVEMHRLTQASQKPEWQLCFFKAQETLGQKFFRLAAQPQRDALPSRSALLQLWAQAVAGLLATAAPEDNNQKLRERFRNLVAKLPDQELATRPIEELAGQLNCSERHFSRIFRQEFGVSLRTRRTELRLLRARQLLEDANTKVIHVAYESGYRHLGLFNLMFKKRFGVTPREWRQKNLPGQSKSISKRGGLAAAWLIMVWQLLLANMVSAQTNSPASNTNTGPRFKVSKYLVSGNSVLAPEKIGAILTNAPGAYGTNVSFSDVRTALGNLQMAYRERGFVTVSVGLPPQKLTNETVRIKVTEGRLAAITVKGNEHFSTENVLRALPSLQTNMLLNSHVFQRELDKANANRDRQIYPVIGPGLEPGTSELTLKVKDRFPLHARVEYNNSGTPGTPDDRIAFSTQYGNLWQLEHQVGLQYGFAPLNFTESKEYVFSPLDQPLVANYSAYYRMPLGPVRSVQQQIDNSGGRFGYNEISHQFQMPPPSGRPELTVYASRSRNDTGIQPGDATTVVSTPLLTIVSQDTGQNLTLNEGIGSKVTWPLPPLGRLNASAALGIDYKHYQQLSFNTNNFYATTYITNSDGTVNPIKSTVSSPQPTRASEVQYFPINFGVSGSVPDSWGNTFFNAQANYNIATVGSLADLAYTAGRYVVLTNLLGQSRTNSLATAKDNYFTVQAGLSREQRIYQDWTVLLRADGQWASSPLFSNEQFGMGGTAGVRGYQDGAAYGDTGWRVAIEPRTPMVNIGMVDGDVPFWVRASVFLDYGEIYSIQKISATMKDSSQYAGTGMALTANIGSHMDARLTVAWPLIGHDNVSDGMRVYFGAGAQF